MDIPEVRRRLRAAIDRARREAGERRERSDQTAREYERFLAERAVPTLQTLTAALIAEGYRFSLQTPAGSVRLASDHSNEDFIEVALDATQDPPTVIGRTSRGRGRRMVTSERAIRERTPVAALTGEDVLDFVLAEMEPFLER